MVPDQTGANLTNLVRGTLTIAVKGARVLDSATTDSTIGCAKFSQVQLNCGQDDSFQ